MIKILDENEKIKINNYLKRHKASNKCFLYGYDIFLFLKGKKKNPKIFIDDNFKNISKFSTLSKKHKKKNLISYHEVYYYFNSNNLKIKECKTLSSNMYFIDIEKYKKIDSHLLNNKIIKNLNIYQKIKNLLFEENFYLQKRMNKIVYKNLLVLNKFPNHLKINAWNLSYENEILELSKIEKAFVKNKNFFDHLSMNLVERLISKLKGHSLSVNYIFDFFNFNKSFNSNIKTMIDVINKYPFFIGYLESQLNRKEFKNKAIESFESIAKDYEKELNEILVEELNLHSLNSESFELNTKLKLMNEGSNMKHCVGGYSRKVKNKFSRIFHLELQGEMATVEFSFMSHYRNKNDKKEKKTEIVISQLKGVRNRKCSELMVEYAKSICEEIKLINELKPIFKVEENKLSSNIIFAGIDHIHFPAMNVHYNGGMIMLLDSIGSRNNYWKYRNKLRYLIT